MTTAKASKSKTTTKPMKAHARKTAGVDELGLTINDNVAPNYQATLQAGETSPASTAVLNRALRGAKASPKAPAAEPVCAAKMTVVSELDLPLDRIKPSPENPRQDWDETFLQQLGESLRDNGQLAPIVVRTPDADGVHELVDGETRWRAATRIGLTSLRASVVECTDAEAAMARLLSYRQRRDLNPIEEARGLSLLLDKYQCSQRELEAKIGISQGQISNRLRLLKLPESFQKLIIAGDVSASVARDLAAWSDFPEIFPGIEKALKSDQGRKEFLSDPTWFASVEAEEVSAELSGSKYGPETNWKSEKWSIDEAKLDAATLALLDVRELPAHGRNKAERRAFNRTLAEKLKQQAIDAVLKRIKAKGDKAAAKNASKEVTAEEQKARNEKNAAVYAKKLWRYYVGWHQQQLLALLDDPAKRPLPEDLATWLLFIGGHQHFSEVLNVGNTGYGDNRLLDRVLKLTAEDAVEWAAVITGLAKERFAGEFDRFTPAIRPELLVAIAKRAGVDIASQWTIDEAFLLLHTREQLDELLREWKVGMYFVAPKGAWEKRSALIEGLMRNKTLHPMCKAPKRLVKAERVSLH